MTQMERIKMRLTDMMRDESETTERRLKASEWLELLQTDPEAFLELLLGVDL
jgi:hypothetical protein